MSRKFIPRVEIPRKKRNVDGIVLSLRSFSTDKEYIEAQERGMKRRGFETKIKKMGTRQTPVYELWVGEKT